MEPSREQLELQINNVEAECRQVEAELERGLETPQVDADTFSETTQRYAQLLVRLKSLHDQRAQSSHRA